MTVSEAQAFFGSLELGEQDAAIADKVLREIRRRLRFLARRRPGLPDAGSPVVDALGRRVAAHQPGDIAGLGAGRHACTSWTSRPSASIPRDNLRLIEILRQLRDQGNTVLVVEHDADMIGVADYIVDLGLGAGEQGGRIVFEGTLEGLRREPRSLTAKYLRDELSIPVPALTAQGHRAATAADRRVRAQPEEHRRVVSARRADRASPASAARASPRWCTTSSMPAVKRAKGDAAGERRAGAFRAIEGTEFISDADPRRPDADRAHAAKQRRHLSQGVRPDPRAVCVDEGRAQPRADGEPLLVQRAGRPLRGVRGRGRRAGRDAVSRRRLRAVRPVRREAVQAAGAGRQVSGPEHPPGPRADRPRGADVLQRLAQGAAPAAGARRDRARLPAPGAAGDDAVGRRGAANQDCRAPGSSGGERLLYVLDEPTTGLHFDDIAKLLAAFRKLLEQGHSLLVIEHNLDVIKVADYIIDLGPEGGEAGGHVVVAGTPEQVAADEAIAHRQVSSKRAGLEPGARLCRRSG